MQSVFLTYLFIFVFCFRGLRMQKAEKQEKRGKRGWEEDKREWDWLEKCRRGDL